MSARRTYADPTAEKALGNVERAIRNGQFRFIPAVVQREHGDPAESKVEA